MCRSVPVPDSGDASPETIRDRRNRIRHPALAAYYSKLALVTQGPLWSARRIIEAIRLSLGGYDSLLDDYVAFQDQKPIEANTLLPVLPKQEGSPMRDCPSWWRPCAPAGAAFTKTGLRVTLSAPSHASHIEVELTRARYVAVFWRDDVELSRQTVGPWCDERSIVEVDHGTRARGFDAVSFLPVSAEDHTRSLTYFLPTP
jgi:hypothetical protein